MIRRWPLLLWLVAVWLLLWETVNLATVVTGAGVAVAALWLADPDGRTRTGTVRPLALARLVAWFAAQLAVASALVAWQVVSRRSRLREGIVAVPLRTGSPALVTVVADAVTLTPGTLVVDLDTGPPVLYVHALLLDDPDRVRSDVRRLEDLVLAAFGPRATGDDRPGPQAPTPEEASA